jgi:hypothetical protein
MIKTWLYNKICETCINILGDTLIANFQSPKSISGAPTTPCPVQGQVLYDTECGWYYVEEYHEGELTDIWSWNPFAEMWVSDEVYRELFELLGEEDEQTEMLMEFEKELEQVKQMENT